MAKWNAVDHKGNTYKNVLEMCNAYNLKQVTFYHRKKLGWSLEECLLGRESYVEDHEGNRFTNLKEMCEHWGISYDAYIHRIKVGWSQYDALTVGVERKNPFTKDHLGNEYPTFKAMCDAYKLPHSVVYRRLTVFGFSLEAALTTPKNVKGYRFLEGVERRKGVALKKDKYTNQFKLVDGNE